MAKVQIQANELLEQTVDSTYLGNKSRFINCETDDKANTQAKILICNGVQRIGLYATRHIEPGEELCFNYGYRSKFTAFKTCILIRYSEDFSKKFVKSKGKAALRAARNKPKEATERRVTLSKNGIRIGRPPRSLIAERLSSATVSSPSRSMGARRGTRKRRRSEAMDDVVGEVMEDVASVEPMDEAASDGAGEGIASDHDVPMPQFDEDSEDDEVEDETSSEGAAEFRIDDEDDF